MTDFSTMTDADLVSLSQEIVVEQKRRADLVDIPNTINTLNVSFLDASGITSGQEWRQPTGAHDAYPEGWNVTHSGINWISLVAGNVWEPGVANWREVTDPAAPPPEWVQPTGSTDAYNTGDKVTYNGVVYTSLIDANVWAPDAYPQGWQVDPA